MRAKKLIRKNILDLTPYSSARDDFKSVKNFIYLDANESSYGNDLNRYPDNRHLKLIELICSYKELDNDNLVLCNGTDELIDLVIRIFCKPGIDKIITLNPTYGMYDVSAKINDVENITINLDSKFQINTSEVISKFDSNTKIIFIANPNNPTGNTFDDMSITKIIESFEGIVFIDEAYVDYSKKSFLKKIKKYDNLIISQTFSKALGLAGIRLGVGYSNKDIIDYLKKVKPPYNINSLTEKKAINSLNEYYVNISQVKETIIERNNLSDKLIKIKSIKKVYPSNSNFILVEFNDAKKIYEQLIQNNIVVRDRSNIVGCSNCLRITVGTPEQNQLLIKTLKNL